VADSSKKISELATAANVAASDRILILRDPLGTPSVRTVNANIFAANLVISNSAPANSTSNGIPGTISYDSSYVYVCVSNNVWKRATLNTW
jgi:hypothetical protein